MTTVISVRFRSGSKTYYFDPRQLDVKTGDDVVVETAQGPEFAQCTEGNHLVNDDAVVKPLRNVLRLATDNDRHTVAYNRSREADAFDICQKKIAQHGLDMKLVRVECSFDGSKILFFFTADGRVDFRELVKDLASVFRSRIELRQIGVRDEAKMLGGLGICGRPFCCSAYMDEFVPVSIKMAKTQNLSLNPTKISGTCGRLMCCLKYEQDAYEDAIKRMPKAESFVVTPDGPGNVSDINVLKETVNVRLDERPESPHCYHNCEVCVLRNGKGSRDGITVPREWPERYVEPLNSDDVLIPSLFADYVEAVPAAPVPDAEEGETRSHRRSRNRRRRGKGGTTPATQENAPAPNRDKPEKAVHPQQESQAPSADGDTPTRHEGQRRRRSRSKGRSTGGPKPAGSSTSTNHNAATAKMAEGSKRPKSAAAEHTPRPEGGDGQTARRPRRRGGRRSNRKPNESSTSEV